MLTDMHKEGDSDSEYEAEVLELKCELKYWNDQIKDIFLVKFGHTFDQEYISAPRDPFTFQSYQNALTTAIATTLNDHACDIRKPKSNSRLDTPSFRFS